MIVPSLKVRVGGGVNVIAAPLVGAEAAGAEDPPLAEPLLGLLAIITAANRAAVTTFTVAFVNRSRAINRPNRLLTFGKIMTALFYPKNLIVPQVRPMSIKGSSLGQYINPLGKPARFSIRCVRHVPSCPQNRRLIYRSWLLVSSNIDNLHRLPR